MKHVTILLFAILLAFFALLARATSAEESRLDCVPGRTVQLEGSAPPATALLVRFGGRPVGGGVSRSDGYYSIPLAIGQERGGEYAVRVEVRSDGTQVGAFVCVVPGPNGATPQRGATAAPTSPGAPTGRPTATAAPNLPTAIPASPVIAPTATSIQATPTARSMAEGCPVDVPEERPSGVPDSPLRITGLNKAGEIVTITNVSTTAVTNLEDWWLCSVLAGQRHEISGTLQPGQTREFTREPNNYIWNDDKQDNAALYDPSGVLISYRVDQ